MEAATASRELADHKAARIAVLAAAGLVLAALVTAQVALPGIAEQRLRDQLRAHGTVLSVHVSAFPAIELLWHHADSVTIRMAGYRSDPTTLGNRVAQAGDVGSLDVSVGALDTGLLTLEHATLHKHGSELSASALVTQQNLGAAVPFLSGVQPVASGNGELTMRGTASVLGVGVSADATVTPRNGSLELVPDLPFGSLATLTLFSNPHLYLEGVSAAAAAGGAFTVSARARLQ